MPSLSNTCRAKLIGRPIHLRAGTVIAAVALVALTGCGTDATDTGHRGPDLPAVRVTEAAFSESDARYRFPGTVRASDRAQLAFLHSGKLIERQARRGQSVLRGDILAVLHQPGLEAEPQAAAAHLREVDARLQQLERDLARARDLLAANAGSVAEMEHAQAELSATAQARHQAVARLDQAQQRLDELTLRAPFDAIVTDLFVEPGDFANAGQPVMELSGTALEVQIRIPSALESRLSNGQHAAVTRVLMPGRFDGIVAGTGRAGTGLAPVIITLTDHPDLAPGQSVHVHITLSSEPVLTVPLSAVQDPGGHEPFVLRVNGQDLIEHIPVLPGRLSNGGVAVQGSPDAGSLADGDRVVVAGHGRIAAGDRVRILP